MMIAWTASQPNSNGDVKLSLTGSRVLRVRPMSPHELEREGWASGELVACLEFDNGALVYAACSSGEAGIMSAQYAGDLWTVGQEGGSAARVSPLTRAGRACMLAAAVFLAVGLALLSSALLGIGTGHHNEVRFVIGALAVANLVAAFCCGSVGRALLPTKSEAVRNMRS